MTDAFIEIWCYKDLYTEIHGREGIESGTVPLQATEYHRWKLLKRQRGSCKLQWSKAHPACRLSDPNLQNCEAICL